MLTHGILNSQLAAALAKLRHKDQFVISDCGLPVPQGVEVIDLALVFGIPRFSDVLNAIKADLVLESGIMAKEACNKKPEEWVKEYLGVPLTYVPHDGDEGFKALVSQAKFVIRTGETTPYSNVLLRCGVPF